MDLSHTHAKTRYIYSYSILSCLHIQEVILIFGHKVILRTRFHLSNSHDPWVFCKNHCFLSYSVRMPYISCFKMDAFQSSHFKMYLAQLSSISKTIQSNSDISSLNVWSTLCLRHSMPAGLWRGLTWHHSPIHIHMFFFSKQLLTAQLYTLILSEDAPIQVAVALWKGEKIIQLLDKP